MLNMYNSKSGDHAEIMVLQVRVEDHYLNRVLIRIEADACDKTYSESESKGAAPMPVACTSMDPVEVRRDCAAAMHLVLDGR